MPTRRGAFGSTGDGEMGPPVLDPEVCYKAVQTRDERFDGRIFVGVVTTGIYCRPVCPAGPPKLENCRFYPSAAAAQEAGFRPCLRCRPETGPEVASWRGTSNTVSRALALIAEGELDADRAGVDALADRLGVGARQLRRLFQKHLGASPVAVAQTRRVLFAKQLLHETRLPMTKIALASGFGSVRRFNETFQELFGRPPSTLRRGVTAESERALAAKGVTVRLRYRPPYDWEAMIAYLRARAVDGVEHIEGATYWRTVSFEGETGTVAIVHEAAANALRATLRLPDVRGLPAVVARIRRVFDLGADVEAIGVHLARDPRLAPLVAARPGLRSPGGWDGFELAVRAVLGQQISVAAARMIAGRLAAIAGTPLTHGEGDRAALVRAFPTALQVTRADLAAIGLTGARRRALVAVAEASIADPTLFHARATVDETVARLRSIPGVGEWTAQYLALRAAAEPDAFPATDRGLQRGAELYLATDASALVERAERWRPWRGYAAAHLWAADAETPRTEGLARVHRLRPVGERKRERGVRRAGSAPSDLGRTAGGRS